MISVLPRMSEHASSRWWHCKTPRSRHSGGTPEPATFPCAHFSKTCPVYVWLDSKHRMACRSGGWTGPITSGTATSKLPSRACCRIEPSYPQIQFRYRDNNAPPVIRVQPATSLNVEYKNQLATQ